MKFKGLILSLFLTAGFSAHSLNEVAPEFNCLEKSRNLFFAMAGVETFLQVVGEPRFLRGYEDEFLGPENSSMVQENLIWGVSDVATLTISFVKSSCRLTKVEMERGD